MFFFNETTGEAAILYTWPDFFNWTDYMDYDDILVRDEAGIFWYLTDVADSLSLEWV